MRQGLTAMLATAVLGVLGASGAMAADMAVSAPIYAKAPAIVMDPWSGWYLGASAGGRWNKDTWTGTGFELPAFPLILNGRDNPHDFNTSSGRIGIYGGYNWRIQQKWVVGVEGDFAWASNKQASVGSIPGLIVATPDTVRVKDTWDGGLRGRLGYLVAPTVLLYGTGGVSWMNSEASITCSGTGRTSWCDGTNNTNSRTDSVSKAVVGWTLGAGIETMIMSHWMLRGEYRYADYGGYHATLLRGGGPAAFPNDTVVDADIKNRTHTALVGLAYKFGQ